MFNFYLRSLAATALAVGLFATDLMAENQQPPAERQLLLPPPEVEMSVNRPRHAIKMSYASVNFELLDQLTPGGTFEIELSGNQYTGIIERSKTQIEGYSLRGTFIDTPNSIFTISVIEDVVAGTFFVPGHGMIRLRFGGANGLHYLHEVAQNSNLVCDVQGEDRRVRQPNAPVSATPSLNEDRIRSDGEDETETQQLFGGCAPPPPTFDIMLVYTAAARRSAGAFGVCIRVECINAVEVTEMTYSTCGLDIRTNIVWLDEVNYDENGTYPEHLDRLIADNDGILDEIHGQRNFAAADFVGLIVADIEAVGNSFRCGRGVCFSDESDAMTVGRWDCITDNLTLAHEIGHNIGLSHDPAGAGDVPCSNIPNAFGNVFSFSIQEFRTVMGTGGATRIPYYSSPNCPFGNTNTGTATRNNVAAIASRQNICEAFRITRMDVFVDSGASGSQNGSFQNPFDTVAEGVNRTLPNPPADLPVLRINAGTYGETLTINKPMIIQSCGGTAIIGN